MLIGFFLHLRAFRLPVSTREFLTLLEALAKRVVPTMSPPAASRATNGIAPCSSRIASAAFT